MVLINKTSVKKFKIRQDLKCLTSGTQQPSIFDITPEEQEELSKQFLQFARQETPILDFTKEQEKVFMEIAKEWAASNPEEK
jgi:hypothetical protein